MFDLKLPVQVNTNEKTTQILHIQLPAGFFAGSWKQKRYWTIRLQQEPTKTPGVLPGDWEPAGFTSGVQ
ncbi:MAG: hypothetical protein AMJ54_10895 [Deltaproteobacteria bacterium SG8_13]|nr:MAG: hypothetical protein AMJ54_10895 [Deltaproteobacteria bacterium SG8_13]